MVEEGGGEGRQRKEKKKRREKEGDGGGRGIGEGGYVFNHRITREYLENGKVYISEHSSYITYSYMYNMTHKMLIISVQFASSYFFLQT